ncbi:MAG: DUF4330 domain-containing protein [Tindallia sp. MSAO_Bac2]|nr:MAG: DUF4330 domain-containing protein [Tindallia sp. MSAO_Bac2]
MKVGKLNWVDGAVILLVLAAAIGFFGRNMILQRTNVAGSISEEIPVLLTAKAFAVPKEVLDSYRIGDAPLAAGREQKGEIVAINSEPVEGYKIESGELVKVVSDDLVDIEITFELIANRYASYIEQASQELKVGSSYYIKTVDAVLKGYIIAMEIIE